MIRWPDLTYSKLIVSNSSWYQPNNELMTNTCGIFFSVKTPPYTETHSFTDIDTIRILDKGNNHSLPAPLNWH